MPYPQQMMTQPTTMPRQPQWGGQNRRRQQRPLTFRDRRGGVPGAQPGGRRPTRMQEVSGMIGSPSQPYRRGAGGGGNRIQQLLQMMGRGGGGGRGMQAGAPQRGPLMPQGRGRTPGNLGMNPITAMMRGAGNQRQIARGGPFGMRGTGQGPTPGGMDMDELRQILFQRLGGGRGGRGF